MAKHGTAHFIAQRITALALVPLAIWFVFALLSHGGDTRADLMEWIAGHPWSVAIPLAMLVLVGFYHMRIGLEVIIDDYIHKPDLRGMLHFLNTFVALVAGAIALWSIIAITLIA
ncbi:succinate dehydrogenase, hydrophobic membrane anchor protein [Aquisalinus flavus]|uniref:Succinate dehydrogenase hydrophobic membrane anchor subunit n=1 Tax=Aquisalinus flavus TaxID=1526572 RepID=A0A8J2V2X1_9PROT|nr:succinate dehydrogenase, hydrophobic membrane anchor protein [Aquisalinus flavus]MBD0425493.1 succinate dehydrogenase, hydrophobic membrane anchor protein [Aquisalinus flavus]UNE48875.1 succinate dehydrogenase, hydrophobic membrane anchor protein [Aquisalinus flavus]GGD15659.1 succinate dehydrogenase membrane anchor subunit [Aquisalinus flavus]